MACMTTKVQQWGNSLGIRLPKTVALALRLQSGSIVDITQENEAVVVRLARSEGSLSDLISRITPENTHQEVAWGSPRGSEVW